jgi:hypothetical protein
MLQDQDSTVEGFNLALTAAAAVAEGLRSNRPDDGVINGAMKEPARQGGEQCGDDDH